MDDIIERWRRSLTGLSPQQVAELEDHVRAEAAQLRERGLSEREAFDVAAGRVGEMRMLRREYEKTAAIPLWRRVLLLVLLVWWGPALLFAPIVGVGHGVEWLAQHGRWPVDWSKASQDWLVLLIAAATLLVWGLALWWMARQMWAGRFGWLMKRIA